MAAAFLALLSAGLTMLLAQQPPETASYRGLPNNEFMRTWLVLGPIPISDERQKPPEDEAQKKAFATDFLSPHGGEAGILPKPGLAHQIAGKDYQWRLVQSKTDTVDLIKSDAPKEFVVAYAWAEIDLPEAATALFGLGSDDAVKVWLNGKLIHENWIPRPVRHDDDLVEFKLQKGRNQLLFKVQNMQGEWGFACRRLGADALAGKLASAAAKGDLDAVQLLLSRGVDVNAKNQQGLTAWQVAKTHGYMEVADLLQSKGADPNAAMPPAEDQIDALFKDLTKGESSGAAVLVARDSKILFKKGYGYANLEQSVPVTPETKFRIGSVTKQFTAAAILKLQEQGKLSVTDKLSKFLPDFPRGEEVTLHHLLTHTSGIHSYTSKTNFFETATAFIKPEDLIKSFKDDPYDFAPGEKWLYNNSGFFLLGYIIEKVSGESYADYLKNQFFAPLGMKETGVHDAKSILKHEATGYSYENGAFKKALNWDMSRAGAAGALYSTVENLYRWNEAVFSGKVLSEANLKAAFTPVPTSKDETPADKLEQGYGYGWSIGKFRGLKTISHGGGLNGFLSQLERYPEQNLTVAVLANAASPAPGLSPGPLAQEIAQTYLWKEMQPRESFKIATSINPSTFDACVGRYDYGGAILTVTRDGGHLFAQLTGQPRFEIFPKSETEFFWKVVDAQVTFVKNEKSEVTKAIHRQSGQTITAPKLEPETVAKVDPAIYSAYVGKYDFGQGAILNVTREGDRLFAQLTGQPKLEIFPKSETEFFWKVVQAQVTFVKNEKGKAIKGIHRQGGKTIEAPRIE